MHIKTDIVVVLAIVVLINIALSTWLFSMS